MEKKENTGIKNRGREKMAWTTKALKGEGLGICACEQVQTEETDPKARLTKRHLNM